MAKYFRGKEYDVAEAARPLDRKVVMILWAFARPFRLLLAWALAVMLLATAADLARPYLIKIAIDDRILAGDTAGLLQTAALYGATVLASVGLTYVQTILLQYIGQKIIFDIRQKVFRHLIYQRYDELDNQPVGQLVTRVTSDTDAIKDLYTDVIVAFASDMLVLSGIVIVMLVIDWRLALVSFTVIPLMFALAAVYQTYARRAYRQVRAKTAAVNSFLQENMNGIAVLKAFGRFRRTQAEYQAENDAYLAAGLREMRTFAVFRPVVDFIYTLAVVLVLWYSGWQTTLYGVEVGIIVAFLRYVEKFFWPIKDLAEKYSLLQSALAAAERVYDMLAARQPSEAPLTKGPDLPSSREYRGTIEFDDVWFAYEQPHWVLQGVSFTIPAGSFVGVAGLSGSGKTTLVSLLLRFYEPQRGQIRLDGTDIRELPVAVLRRRVGVVFQDVHLFDGTVADNISLFERSMTRPQIEEAARLANIHEYIVGTPHGYDTPIGYQGALLSVGQRQLLSLARVLAFRAEVLVLDEATSSVDGETEIAIQRALANIARNRTMLVVAHRLSTVREADNILLMHRGRIVEQGTHERLMAEQGLYYRLYNSQ